MARLTRSHFLAAACLAASAALATHTLRTARETDDVRARPAVPPLADASEAARRTRELAGTYATGSRPGDRILTLRDDGRVEFAEIGRADGRPLFPATPFTPGQQGRTRFLVLPEGEPIEVVNLDTLRYYRDTYRRR
jgi:hypothetical protein